MKRKLQAENNYYSQFILPRLGFIILVIIGFTFSSQAQLIIEIDECNCLEYPEVNHTGRFEERIKLTSPADKIIVSEIKNFYDVTSPDDMFILYPDGLELTEAPQGMFSLTGLRREGAPWSMIVSEITNLDTVRTLVESQFICSYPDAIIYGDANNCIGTVQRYYIDLDMDEIDDIEWVLSGGGTIIGPIDSNNVLIRWGTGTGVFNLSVTVEGIDGATESNQYCEFESVLSIELVDEEAITMACKNEVNLSIDGLCEFMVTPEIFLRNFPYPPGSFDIELKDLEADTILHGNMIYGAYIGKRLGVSVIHDCSQNSCWGSILLKDEVAPPLFCRGDTIVDCGDAIDPDNLGFPVPESAWVEQIDFNNFFVSNYDQCGEVYLNYKDTPLQLECDALYGSVIERTWTITDPSGNSNFCSFLIYINKSEFSEIVFPEDYDDELGTQPSLSACGDWEKLENGAPAPGVTGMPEGALCLNVHIEFKDLIFYKCSKENIDKTFKVWRRWTVADHCPDGMDSVHVQIISVRDTVAPVVTVPDNILAGTTPHKCGADIPIPRPEVEDCSIWDYKVGYKIKNENGQPSGETFYYNVEEDSVGNFIIKDIPGGEKELWIVYTVTDACGNFTIATSELIIMDDEEPIAVCDQYTFVSLDKNGIAHVGVESFNDGSWDNCGIDRIEVRRAANFSCGARNDWGKKVEFCCADVGKEVMVSLRVVDDSGNSNTCMVLVEVQNNLPPEFTFVPNDTTIQCEDNLEDLTKYGEAKVRGNCVVSLEEKVINNLNDCGLGTIIRKFIATDNSGNSVCDSQTIIVINDLVLNKDSIDFPADLILKNGCTYNIHPDSLPDGFNFPVFIGNGCTRVTWSYEDQEFIYVEEACRKIIRKWSVIDWCQFDYNDKESGIFIGYQVIKISNSIAPEINSCGQQPAFEFLDGCQVYATIIGTATDDCTPASKLKWSFKIDFYDDDTIDRTGSGNNASGVLPIGSHRIYWEVTDECANTGYCDYVIAIEDNKAPSPVCLTDIVTVIMDVSGSVEIWASDFDKSSFDNCGDTSNLYFSFSPDTLDANMIIDCDMLMGNDIDTFQLKMHVIDQKGNYDFCEVELIVQDNGQVCPEIELNEETTLSGNIISVDNTMIDDVEILLVKAEDESFQQAQMAISGEYAFHNIEMYDNYAIIPEKNGEAGEGVSTLDLVKIQRHILGKKLFTSPYEFIAADVNNNGRISASDVIQLRKLILGLYDQFPSNKSWRFVDARYDFGDKDDILGFPETINIDDLQGPLIDNNFVGVKIGDVDHSYSNRFNNLNTRSSSTFYYQQNQDLDLVVFDFYCNETDLVGFQFSLNYDPEMLEFKEVRSKELSINENHYHLVSADRSMINMSWNTENEETSADRLFSLVFHKIKYSDLAAIHQDKYGLSGEIYRKEGDIIITESLKLVQEVDPEIDFSLSQNVPNPFHSVTRIGYTIPHDDHIRINVFDLTGKMVLQKSISATKGINEISINASEIGGNGVFYYQISTSSGALSRKMVVIN